MPKRYIPNDKWSKRAASEGFRARSVYKLQELDVRYRLFSQGMNVFDVGAAPGSWLQYVSERIGSKGKAVGIDLKEIAPIAENVQTYVCDIRDHDAVQNILESEGMTKVDRVISDIAPNTSGIRDVDQWRSVELSMMVFELSEKILRKSGILVMKVFRGKSFDEFYASLKPAFARIQIVNVDATRDRSMEVYVVCIGKKAKSGETPHTSPPQSRGEPTT